MSNQPSNHSRTRKTIIKCSRPWASLSSDLVTNYSLTESITLTLLSSLEQLLSRSGRTDDWWVTWQLQSRAIWIFNLLRQQTVFNRPLRVWLQFFNLVNFAFLHNVFLNAHCKPDQANYTQHMLVVVEKSRARSVQTDFVSVESNAARLEKFCLLNMRPVHFIKFPAMTVSVDDPRVFYCRIHIRHVFQAPQTSWDCLR